MNAYFYMTKHGGFNGSATMFKDDKGTQKTDPLNKINLIEEVISNFEKELTIKENDEQQLEQKSSYNLYMNRFKFQLFQPLNGHLPSPFFISPTSNLWIGTGSTSITETLLTLHRIYGVPYIPGTALKGMAAHYCHRYLGKENEKFLNGGDYFNILFGSQDYRSFIYYYDAFPTPETVAKSLKLDVMTPHHKDYNISPSEQVEYKRLNGNVEPAAPRDDDSPEPILFMSARANFKVLLSCENDDEAGQHWLDIAKEIILQAIRYEGIGGKTSTGYGRFKEEVWDGKDQNEGNR
ncbi:type III-B CRISPR module RAMP protein Cmr6 [Paenibacillus sp. L3-i20]|uniref:type III-B CRISPR module RAMP protein Cmr6 n=1 Tax=Paenibacillus sp. L3-i20 TaxID=2905833 RepID=UPI001EDF71E0|nr:type III-B CRISPR module RAMP protein Cmr6 [Paenibacillus sp. L3-i20]GKU76473.1 hypothetical protein L3i20_v208700 [Paenibacillus sp. L3-i20]